jgi:hypothetical protein
VPGYGFDKETKRQEFVVETLDERILRFDPETGKLIQERDKLEDFRKSAWFQQQKDWVLKTDPGLETPRSVLVGHIEAAQPKAGGFVGRVMNTVQVFSARNPSNNRIRMMMFLRSTETANDLPRVGEFWAFSGFTTNRMLFEVRSAIKITEAEPPEEKTKK